MIERRIPRLYVASGLAFGVKAELDRAQAHYLRSVLRLETGAAIAAFYATVGEWLCHVAEFGKRGARLSVEAQLRAPEPESEPDLWLLFAPIKRARLDWLVEKATELGAARRIPVMTQRTVAERVRLDRLESIPIQAAEHCGRSRLPKIEEPVSLKQLINSQEPSRTLYFADENGGDAVSSAFKAGPALILVGPEGGFTDEERTLVRSTANAVAISLGPRILRAETAALAALASFMALTGDWG
jgi:16S rRNA (uracil1498-N3)-methyltransferase